VERDEKWMMMMMMTGRSMKEGRTVGRKLSFEPRKGSTQGRGGVPIIKLGQVTWKHS